MSASVIRLKRKSSCEPIEGLVIAVKKSKCDENVNSNQVYFKFAATLKNDKESIKDHIQAALSKDKDSKFSKWRDPKCIAVNQKNVYNICEKVKKQCKAVSEKKKLDLLYDRRLIFTETFPIDDNKENYSEARSAEVQKLFQLYDIIEENEEPKKQVNSSNSDDKDVAELITCNDEPLIREKAVDYVYDVYIADGQIDDSFVENTVSLRPCTMTNDDIYSGDSDDNSEIYEDEDDSNDENNWRNDYPEEEESDSEKDSDEESYNEDIYYDEMRHSVSHLYLGDYSDDEWQNNSDVLEPLPDDYGDD